LLLLMPSITSAPLFLRLAVGNTALCSRYHSHSRSHSRSRSCLHSTTCTLSRTTTCGGRFCLPERASCSPGLHGHRRAHDGRRHQEALAAGLQPEVLRIPPRHTPLPMILPPAPFTASPSAGLANLRPAAAARTPPPPRTPSPAAQAHEPGVLNTHTWARSRRPVNAHLERRAAVLSRGGHAKGATGPQFAKALNR
jgi:hypothetical protein